MDVSLECELLGTPPFEVTWFKDRRQIRSSKKHKVTSKNHLASVHILNVEAPDIGDYHCKASNDIGSDTCICNIKLKGNSFKQLAEIKKKVLINHSSFIFALRFFVQSHQNL